MQTDLVVPHIKSLILRWKDNDESALNHLITIAYHRRQALGYYGNSASLQCTELVNELYLHFRTQKEVKYHNAEHFFAISTLKLRQILSSRFEKNMAKKRNHGEREDISAAENKPSVFSSIEIFVLNDYLDFLEYIEPVSARIAELKLFWEFNNSEVAELLGLSESTVRRKWNASKMLIKRRLEENDASVR